MKQCRQVWVLHQEDSHHHHHSMALLQVSKETSCNWIDGGAIKDNRSASFYRPLPIAYWSHFVLPARYIQIVIIMLQRLDQWATMAHTRSICALIRNRYCPSFPLTVHRALTTCVLSSAFIHWPINLNWPFSRSTVDIEHLTSFFSLFQLAHKWLSFGANLFIAN